MTSKIRNWIEITFNDNKFKTFIEVGANDGSDTKWMSDIPNVTVHAFEPDPRLPALIKRNVFWNHRAAVGNQIGVTNFYPSLISNDIEWTQSGSIHRPTGHLERYPKVKFGEPFEILITTLDNYCHTLGIKEVDFIWVDAQGAEGDVIQGGQEILTRTRFLYTEYSDIPMYESQVSLSTLVEMLPGSWEIIKQWPRDVLLRNTCLSQ